MVLTSLTENYYQTYDNHADQLDSGLARFSHQVANPVGSRTKRHLPSAGPTAVCRARIWRPQHPARRYRPSYPARESNDPAFVYSFHKLGYRNLRRTPLLLPTFSQICIWIHSVCRSPWPHSNGT